MSEMETQSQQQQSAQPIIKPVDLSKREHIVAYSKIQALRIIYRMWQTTWPIRNLIDSGDNKKYEPLPEYYIPQIYILNSSGNVIAENPFEYELFDRFSLDCMLFYRHLRDSNFSDIYAAITTKNLHMLRAIIENHYEIRYLVILGCEDLAFRQYFYNIFDFAIRNSSTEIITYLITFANTHNISIVDYDFYTDYICAYYQLLEKMTPTNISFIKTLDSHESFIKLPTYYRDSGKQNAELNAKFIYNLINVANGSTEIRFPIKQVCDFEL